MYRYLLSVAPALVESCLFLLSVSVPVAVSLSTGGSMAPKATSFISSYYTSPGQCQLVELGRHKPHRAKLSRGIFGPHSAGRYEASVVPAQPSKTFAATLGGSHQHLKVSVAPRASPFPRGPCYMCRPSSAPLPRSQALQTTASAFSETIWQTVRARRDSTAERSPSASALRFARAHTRDAYRRPNECAGAHACHCSLDARSCGRTSWAGCGGTSFDPVAHALASFATLAFPVAAA
ncbi:hypothetical protein A0H81_11443 [Grifola frondosa]|uniref:Secreted protein n=1 Tax=Grifola frondosa TaxID=5627 RepID=A0A1C7LVG4_GRIFR|nr:hypothetical protein A0H81_11443 [Grifola frondosa]